MPSKPKHLYKYRSFSALSIESLVADQVYLANPADFNDPLDTNPVVTGDIALDELEQLVSTLVQRRLTDEMKAAASAIRYKGPRTLERIDALGQRQVRKTLADIRYHATNPEYGNALEAKRWLLVDLLQQELLRQYTSGVLSLAERVNCPLMWSHYGDQHRGVCIGYAVLDPAPEQLHKVQYGGSRQVEASLIARRVEGDEGASAAVDAAVLLRKARDWRYEREWRLIGKRGLMDSPFELADVTFGFRCSTAVKWTVASSLANRAKPVKFYEIHEVPGTFLLKRRLGDNEELGMQ